MSANKVFRPRPYLEPQLLHSIRISCGIPVVGVVLLCSKTDRVAVFQRDANQSGAGDWEFPGGKVEPGESIQAALCREIAEELSFTLHIEQMSFIGDLVFAYPSKTIHLILFRHECDSTLKPLFRLSDHQDFKWVQFQELTHLNLSRADSEFVQIAALYQT
jgi:8-oxo-dGTP diphosphatase